MSEYGMNPANLLVLAYPRAHQQPSYGLRSASSVAFGAEPYVERRDRVGVHFGKSTVLETSLHAIAFDASTILPVEALRPRPRDHSQSCGCITSEVGDLDLEMKPGPSVRVSPPWSTSFSLRPSSSIASDIALP